MPVFTQAQNTTFFTDPEQMGIPQATYQHMHTEGILDIEHLAEFDKDSIKQLAENLRRPGGTVPDPDGEEGDMIPTPPFVFGIRSQKRLIVACDLIRYYYATDRTITPQNVLWRQMSDFEIQWKALKEKQDEDAPDVPKITKALPIIKWTEAFQDFLSRVIGSRTTPLSYVIRPNVNVANPAPALEQHKPHSSQFRLS